DVQGDLRPTPRGVVVTVPTGLRSLAEDFKEAHEFEFLNRETLATALHALLCMTDHEGARYEWNPIPGGNNRYQRHADVLLNLANTLDQMTAAPETMEP